jgi:hypothetical protein
MPNTTPAMDIVKQMAATYAALDSYQDSGYVQTTFSPGTTNGHVSLRPFKTYFRRPNLFRFEWTDRFGPDSPERFHTIWCDGKIAYEKYPDEKIKNVRRSIWHGRKGVQDDLSLAIAGATGVSGGSAHNVSSMLMNVGGFRYCNATAASLTGESTVDSERCLLVKLSDSRRDEQLSISVERNILRKISDDYILEPLKEIKALESGRFKSINGFRSWIMLRKYHANRSHLSQPLHVVGETVYESVLLNPDIPIETFNSQPQDFLL